MALIVSLVYTATLMPYTIAVMEPGIDIWVFYVDVLNDFIFIFDIYVNFNTPFLKSDKEYEYRRKNITINYLKTWFVIDLLSALPLTLLSELAFHKGTFGNSPDLVRLIRLLRSYRLFKIARFTHIIGILRKMQVYKKFSSFINLNLGVIRLIKFFIILLISIHVAACIFIIIA